MIKVIKALLKSRNSSQKAGGREKLSDRMLTDISALGSVSGARGGGFQIGMPEKKP
ncbi:hypothetical protein [Pseudoalteromonas citrea]|uniref:hypothetical protein n=1 Tax=Pseudoalteromonas citrea TaxID=43655 RepID=UPI001486D4F4|nr:hypothetical protein [Pseudoalteromonas citrea]